MEQIILKGFWGESGLSKEIDKRDYQNIEGLKVEITKKEYWHFLECLPPLDFNGENFYLMEFLTGDLTLYFTVVNKKYYCEVKQYKGSNRDY